VRVFRIYNSYYLFSSSSPHSLEGTFSDISYRSE
jgi:hypothetical protein